MQLECSKLQWPGLVAPIFSSSDLGRWWRASAAGLVTTSWVSGSRTRMTMGTHQWFSDVLNEHSWFYYRFFYVLFMVWFYEMKWDEVPRNLPNPSMGPGGQTQLQGHSYLLMITPPTGSNHHLLCWIFPFLSIFHVWKQWFSVAKSRIAPGTAKLLFVQKEEF